MKKILYLYPIIVCLIFITSCVTVPSYPPRINVAGELHSRITIEDYVSTISRSKTLEVQVSVKNETTRPLRLDYSVDWKDGRGISVRSILTGWNTITLRPGIIENLIFTAPNENVVEYQIYLERSRR